MSTIKAIESALDENSEKKSLTYTDNSSANKRSLDVNVDAVNEGILAGVTYDYVSMAISPATTETYTFKTGGSGGTEVAVIVVVYTDSTRADLSTVTRTT